MIEHGDGFMGFWSHIDPAYQLTYQKWHNCEHMPERVSVPGFIEGRRYRSLDDPSEFFMCYITEEPEVLRSEAYLAALNRPTPWTQEALTEFQKPRRTLFRRVASAGSATAYHPYLVLTRFDHAGGADALAERLLPPLADEPNSAGAVFEMDVDASAIMTAERKIYAGGPSRQQFLMAAETFEPGAVARLGAGVPTLLGEAAQHVETGAFFIEARVFAEEVRANASRLAEVSR